MTLNLRLDKPGNIEIYVAGDYSNALQITDVNGTDITSSTLAPTISSLASRVLIESHGNISLGWNDLGTLFAPTGNATLASLTNEYGAVYAGNTATFGGGANVYYNPLLIPNTTIPEPTTILSLPHHPRPLPTPPPPPPSINPRAPLPLPHYLIH